MANLYHYECGLCGYPTTGLKPCERKDCPIKHNNAAGQALRSATGKPVSDNPTTPVPAAPGEKKGEPASKTSEPQLYRHFVLHVLRNPWGVAEETIRKVRLDAADIIEQLEQELAVAREVANRETLSAAYWKDKASAVSARLTRDVERMRMALAEVCYEPGKHPGFTSINYCRWCHYADTHPHHPDCVMAAADKTASDKGQG
jgi:hypothetical protein